MHYLSTEKSRLLTLTETIFKFVIKFLRIQVARVESYETRDKLWILW